MTDDAIRQIHGVACRKHGNFVSRVTVRETDEGEIGLYASDSTNNERYLTEWQARYLAARLYQLSRRIRKRREAKETIVARIGEAA
jgi:hypothetical protein